MRVRAGSIARARVESRRGNRRASGGGRGASFSSLGYPRCYVGAACRRYFPGKSFRLVVQSPNDGKIVRLNFRLRGSPRRRRRIVEFVCPLASAPIRPRLRGTDAHASAEDARPASCATRQRGGRAVTEWARVPRVEDRREPRREMVVRSPDAWSGRFGAGMDDGCPRGSPDPTTPEKSTRWCVRVAYPPPPRDCAPRRHPRRPRVSLRCVNLSRRIAERTQFENCLPARLAPPR